MRLFQNLLVALSLGLLSFGSSASLASPQNKVDFRMLDKPQQTMAGKKVEVIEFFSYACEHCNAFDPALTAWVKKQGDKIAFKRVPIAFRDFMVPQQKLFYALEVMGKLDDLHHKVFHAIHVQKQQLNSDSAVTEFAVGNGLDKQKFVDAYQSFGVQSKAARATQMQQAYQVNSVPMIAIDGRYLSSPGILAESMGNRPVSVLHTAAFQVMDWLVEQSSKAK